MSRDRAEWHEVTALISRAARTTVDCALRDLPRIAPLLTRADGHAAAVFRFYRLTTGDAAAAAHDAAECTVRATLPLTCQRCLGEVEVQVDAHAELAFVDDEAAVSGVPESHDPVITTAGRVSLSALVEEELLLAMPIVPAHADPAQCQMRPREEGEEHKADVVTPAPTQMPFAGLRELLKK